MKLIAFLSSAMTGDLVTERAGVQTLFASEPYLRDMFELYAIEDHASARSIQSAFLDQVEHSDVIIVLLGTELREAVRQELEHARQHNKRILCYVRHTTVASAELREFVNGQVYPTHHVGHFHDTGELVRRVRLDLRSELVRVYREAARTALSMRSVDEYAILALSTPFSSTAFFAPSDVAAALGRPEFVDRDASQLIALAMLTVEETGNFRHGLLLLEVALVKDPRNWMALADRGLLLREMGLLHEALESLERAIRIDSTHAVAHYNVGNCQMAAGRYGMAVNSFREALRIEPDKWSAVAQLAACYIQLDDSVNALEWAVRAEALESDEATRCNLALALGLAGRSDEARRTANEGIADPLRKLEVLAYIAFHSGDYAECLRCVHEYRALANPPLRTCLLEVRSQIQLGPVGAAQLCCDQLADSFPLHSEQYNECAYLLMERFGASEFVAAKLKRAVELDPSSLRTWNNLQACLFELKMYDEGLDACERALEIHPFDKNSITNKVLALQAVGREQDAVSFAEAKVRELLEGVLP